MPFYEYECDNCKFYQELLQKVSDPPLKKCPSCGKNTMKKLVSAPVFRLKGGGWYETDFKGDKENKRNLAIDKEPDSSSDAKPAKAAGDAKADSKPEAKADAKPAESKPAAEVKSSGGGSRRSAAPVRPAASKSRTKAPVKAKAKKKAGGRR